LRSQLQRDFRLASEDEIAHLFKDCEPGAVPPLGPAYGIETLLDEALANLDEVYFEAGDHEQLVHIRGEDFQGLLTGVRRGYYSHDS
jgi:Ala-tRNA(Pro) deacylase